MIMINHKPDFAELLKVLRLEPADKPVLYEFIIEDEYCRKYSARYNDADEGSLEYFLMVMDAFKNLGYDYAPVHPAQAKFLAFPKAGSQQKASRSQNEGGLITDRESFENYLWPSNKNIDYSLLDKLAPHLPDGMKLTLFSNGGILENAIDMVGFEQLCMMYMMDPELTKEIFDQIGSRLLEFYRVVSAFDSVGLCNVNDDWGFKTQSMFPPEMMREYVFPWMRKIVEAVHANGKPVVFHSCGQVKELMPEIIHDIKIDGKHSFEDQIYKVEEAYDWWGKEVAIMGGIDMDFLCRAHPEEIYRRAYALLEKTYHQGGYALGSGNSITYYVPEENYLSMLKAARDFSNRE